MKVAPDGFTPHVPDYGLVLDSPKPRARRLNKDAYFVRGFNERHREIIRLKHKGLDTTDIAAILNLSDRSVKYCLATDMAKKELEDLAILSDSEAIDVNREIQVAAQEAVLYAKEVVNGTVEGISPTIRLKASQDMLDRAGHGKITKVQGRVDHGYAGEIGIKLILERAQEIEDTEFIKVKALETN